MSLLQFDKKLFEEIYNIPGVSGDEEYIRNKVYSLLKACKNIGEVKVDGIGNVLGHINKGKDLPTVLVSAHMDTVGMRITKVQDEKIEGALTGSIFFQCIGLARDHLCGTKVRIHTKNGDVLGAICNKGVHLRDVEVVPDPLELSLNRMIVDIGLCGKRKVKEMGIEEGNSMSFEAEYTILGEDDMISGPFIDNRSGVANVITLARKLDKSKLNVNVVLAFTVHEESDLSGVKCLVNNLKPACAIVMDTTPAFQHDLDAEIGALEVGKGAAIEIGTYANKKLIEIAEAVATKYKIDYQRDVIVDEYTTGITESWPTRWYGNGTPAISIGWPVRYLHTAVETAHIPDISKALTIVKQMLYTINKDTKYF